MTSIRLQKQFGALPFRHDENGQIEILLITSRDTGRWVIPKGWPMKGKRSYEAAAQEAWEEAGAVGKVSKFALGKFEYDKLIPGKEAVPCRVAVFALAVSHVDCAWPEFGQRQRRWMSAELAAASVNEKGLKKIIWMLAKAFADTPARRKKGDERQTIVVAG